MFSAWATMPPAPGRPPFTDAVAARCTPELVAKLDEFTEVVAAASPVAVRLNRSDVARAALEVGSTGCSRPIGERCEWRRAAKVDTATGLLTV